MAATAVTLWGLVRGTDLAGPGTVDLVGDAVRVEPQGRAPLFVRFSALDGIRVGPGELTLFLATGDVIEFVGTNALNVLARHLESAAYVVPEFTRALRAFGSARGSPGLEHDRFYEPFLGARRAAQRATDLAGRLAAFEPSRLRGQLEAVLRAMAAEHFPHRAPDRRALEAELRDLAARAFAALDRLGEAARVVVGGGHQEDESHDDVSLVHWRVWAESCRAVFAEVDRCWEAAALVLAEAHEEPGGKWWRLWRRRT